VWIDDGHTIAFFSSGAAGAWPTVQGSRLGTGGDPTPITIWTDDVAGRPKNARPNLKRRDSAFFSQRTPMHKGARPSGLWLLDVGPETGDVADAPADARLPMRHPIVSPDGHWIAYESGAPGRRTEVYLRSHAGGGRFYQVSINGGSEPVWSRDGRELFFIGTPSNGGPLSIMSVTLRGRKPLAISAPRLVLSNVIKVPQNHGGTSYDVSADGRQFLILAEAPQPTGANMLMTRQPGARRQR
jgi:hypothetical protein